MEASHAKLQSVYFNVSPWPDDVTALGPTLDSKYKNRRTKAFSCFTVKMRRTPRVSEEEVSHAASHDRQQALATEAGKTSAHVRWRHLKEPVEQLSRRVSNLSAAYLQTVAAEPGHTGAKPGACQAQLPVACMQKRVTQVLHAVCISMTHGRLTGRALSCMFVRACLPPPLEVRVSAHSSRYF